MHGVGGDGGSDGGGDGGGSGGGGQGGGSGGGRDGAGAGGAACSLLPPSDQFRLSCATGDGVQGFLDELAARVAARYGSTDAGEAVLGGAGLQGRAGVGRDGDL